MSLNLQRVPIRTLSQEQKAHLAVRTAGRQGEWLQRYRRPAARPRCWVHRS